MKRIALAITALTALLALIAWASPSNHPTNPLTDGSVTPELATLSGRVDERLLAGSYVYLHLIDASGTPHWLVTLDGPATRASLVTARLFARAERFHSARLHRDFESLHFASLTPHP
ncbi:MAG: hypothetical protein U0228_28945 [Myxococcaceae bacterium]